MTKQQFLSFSLPFGLFCQVLDKGNVPKFVKLSAVYNDGEVSFFDTIESNHCFKSVKPLLRPLSELLVEITHNGEKFIPISRLIQIDGIKEVGDINPLGSYIKNIGLSFVPFCIIEKLIEWHFDIAGLIEKEEAINITLLANFSYY